MTVSLGRERVNQKTAPGRGPRPRPAWAQAQARSWAQAQAQVRAQARARAWARAQARTPVMGLGPGPKGGQPFMRRPLPKQCGILNELSIGKTTNVKKSKLKPF